MFIFTFTGIAAEHFAAARQLGLDLRTAGPDADKVWVKLGEVWRVAPRQAMPLLLGVLALDEAERAAALFGGSLRKLDRDEFHDLLVLLGAARGGATCH